DSAVLIEHRSPAFRILSSTRLNPGDGFYRLRLADELIEVDRDHLRFTRDEVRSLARILIGRNVTFEEADSLLGHTEGWAFGLHLACRVLAGEDGADEDRELEDYFNHHVMRGLPDDLRSFLVATAVLDRVTGPLARALTGHAGSDAVLEDLPRNSLFGSRVDAEH